MSAIRDEDVCRLDVAMHDAFAVGGVERVGNLNREFEKLVGGQGAAADKACFSVLPSTNSIAMK